MGSLHIIPVSVRSAVKHVPFVITDTEKIIARVDKNNPPSLFYPKHISQGYPNELIYEK